jgi:hypothetical protein
MKTAAVLAWATALAYLGTGALFFGDPTRNEPAGSTAYWEILATEPVGRTLFVAAFALTGLFALGTLESIGRLVGAGVGTVVRYGLLLAYLGYAVNAISYVRLLGGESTRAKAYANGSPEAREAIESSSLVLDPDGWLTFGAVGAFLVIVNVVAFRRKVWALPLAIVGIAAALASWVAMAGLVSGNDDLLALAAGIGGVVLGPIWWIGVGRELWAHTDLPLDERPHVEERDRRPDDGSPSAEDRPQLRDTASTD